MPDFDGAILFLEDVEEQPYRVDRMMTHAGLPASSSECAASCSARARTAARCAGYASFTLEEILNDHLKPLDVPAWQGAMIGHGMPQWTLPVGLEVEIDAGAGTITMTEPAVA